MPDEPDKLEALHAHREALERLAAQARESGDQKSYDMTQLLLRQCDFLIEKAKREENARGPDR